MAEHVPPHRVITNGTMTGTAALTSLATNIQRHACGMYTASWTGTPVGTLSIEGSNDWDPARETGEWTALSITGSGNPAGTATNTYIQTSDIGCAWVRCKYVNASGTGVLNVYFAAKAG